LDVTTVFDDGTIDDLTYDAIDEGSPVDDWIMGDTDDVAIPQSVPPVDDLSHSLSLASVVVPVGSRPGCRYWPRRLSLRQPTTACLTCWRGIRRNMWRKRPN
jgi:hypothetical protein